MKSLAALTITALLSLAALTPVDAATVAPAGIAGALIQAEAQDAIEDVRWVKRCRMVRVVRHGHRSKVQRCSRVWVR